MDSKTKQILIKIGAIVSLISGILLCVTIIGAILGVFCIIAYTKLNPLTQLNKSDFEKAMIDKKEYGWAIFVLIVEFPIGLCAFLPYVMENVGIAKEEQKPTVVEATIIENKEEK